MITFTVKLVLYCSYTHSRALRSSCMFLLISNFNNIGNWLRVSLCCKETTVKVAQSCHISVRSRPGLLRARYQAITRRRGREKKTRERVYHTRKCASYMLCSITRKSTQHSCVVPLNIYLTLTLTNLRMRFEQTAFVLKRIVPQG